MALFTTSSRYYSVIYFYISFMFSPKNLEILALDSLMFFLDRTLCSMIEIIMQYDWTYYYRYSFILI
jgi:hypothetical protein